MGTFNNILGLLTGQQHPAMVPQQPMFQPQDAGGANISSRIQEWLGAKQPQQGGSIQDILSQRFQATPSDTYSAIVKSAPLGSPLMLGSDIAGQRGAGSLELMAKLAAMQDMQIKMQQLTEQTRHDYATEAQAPGAQPITTSPTTPSAGGGPLMQGGGQVNRPVMPMSSSNGQPLQNGNVSGLFINQPPKPGDPDYNPAMDGIAGGGQGMPSPQQNQGLTPLYKGNEPDTGGMKPGYQAALTPDGRRVAMQIPGTIEEGKGGNILRSDANGNVTQEVPKNPQAQAKLEGTLQQLAQKINALHTAGGTVEEGGSFLDNKMHQLASTEGFGPIPGGQSLMQGTKTQTLRDDIQALTKQILPLYMQAVGLTPGMERSLGAQRMLLSALGSGVDKSRQHLLFSLGNISKLAGTGELAGQLGGQPQQNQQSQQQSQSQNDAFQDGQTATNPQTGQKIIFRNGGWANAQ